MLDGDALVMSIADLEKCWPVIRAFAYKSGGSRFKQRCMVCGSTVAPGKYFSSFISHAVAWTCEHEYGEFICSACDEDFLWRVSLRKQKCLRADCGGDLSVKMAEVERRLGSDSVAFKEYRELVFGGVEECVVCGEEEYHCDAPVTKYCQHLRNICPSCLKQMIKIAVKKGGWADIRCPDTSCRKQLEYNDVKQAATKEDFEQYDDFLIRQAAKGMPNFTPCNRPGGVCKMGQIHEAGDSNPQMKCFSCDYESCFSCSAAWHEGQTCAQAHSLLPEDTASDEWKRKYCKRCPGAGCGLYIKKNGACHEMQCPKTECKALWCWECKIIVDSSVGYSARAQTLHLATCQAPLVRTKRQGTGFKSVPKPDIGDGRYRRGWDEDEGFEGDGEEY